MKRVALIAVLPWLCAAAALGEQPVAFHSPGFPPSHVDQQGRLVEDWGTLGVELAGEVADGPNSSILGQVTNGLAIRMAVLFLINQAAAVDQG